MSSSRQLSFAADSIGVARGALGVRAPQGGENNWAKFTGGVVSAPPGRARVEFCEEIGDSGQREWLI